MLIQPVCYGMQRSLTLNGMQIFPKYPSLYPQYHNVTDGARPQQRFTHMQIMARLN